MPETTEGLPKPDLERRPITLEEYHACTVEHLELLDGYLCDGPPPSQRRRELLQLLMANAGLLEAVRLAPQELWRDALRRVYGLGLG